MRKKRTSSSALAPGFGDQVIGKRTKWVIAFVVVYILWSLSSTSFSKLEVIEERAQVDVTSLEEVHIKKSSERDTTTEREREQDSEAFDQQQDDDGQGPHDVVVSQLEAGDPLSVCTIANNPRQGSIFRTNLMASLGSGKYTYDIAQKCSFKQRRVRMISYVKCCQDLETVKRKIKQVSKMFDVVIVTGDEYCAVDPLDGVYQYRQYWGDNVMLLSTGADGSARPQFFPLGPRSEFERIDQDTGVPLASDRKYAFNFAGSPSSKSRKALRESFETTKWLEHPLKDRFFIKFSDGWAHKIKEEKGFVNPQKYQELLLDSAFTLCPMGHNPEAYRIYESCEAGSIPIVTIDEMEYTEHKCKNAFKPFIQSGAPFIFLNTWDDLDDFIVKAMSNSTFLIERQASLRRWYASFMRQTALEFEAALESRFQERTGQLNL